MPTLQVRFVPEHIYRELERQADRERRSLAQQTLAVIAKGLEMPLDNRERRRAVLAEIKSTVPRSKTNSLPDIVKMIREDRNR